MPAPLEPPRSQPASPGRSETREAAALRENLLRRKQQTRARASPQPAAPEREPRLRPEPPDADRGTGS